MFDRSGSYVYVSTACENKYMIQLFNFLHQAVTLLVNYGCNDGPWWRDLLRCALSERQA